MRSLLGKACVGELPQLAPASSSPILQSCLRRHTDHLRATGQQPKCGVASTRHLLRLCPQIARVRYPADGTVARPRLLVTGPRNAVLPPAGGTALCTLWLAAAPAPVLRHAVFRQRRFILTSPIQSLAALSPMELCLNGCGRPLREGLRGYSLLPRTGSQGRLSAVLVPSACVLG